MNFFPVSHGSTRRNGNQTGDCPKKKHMEMFAAALSEGTHLFEWVHMRADGTEFPTDVLLTG